MEHVLCISVNKTRLEAAAKFGKQRHKRRSGPLLATSLDPPSGEDDDGTIDKHAYDGAVYESDQMPDETREADPRRMPDEIREAGGRGILADKSYMPWGIQ
jgi:hypothetical protein